MGRALLLSLIGIGSACTSAPPPAANGETPPTASVPAATPAPIATPPTSAPAPSTAPTVDEPASGLNITLNDGRYRSAACGPRTYERHVVLGFDKSLSMEDHVSPCPKGQRCAWSGIVIRKGRYTVRQPESLGKPYVLELELSPGAPASAGKPPPKHLEWFESRGDLTEAGDTCVYRSVP